MVISREIRPLAALYPPLHTKKMRYRAAISSFALDLCSQWLPGAVCSCLLHLCPFLFYQSKKKYGGWYNAARGLISRDILDKNCYLSYVDCRRRSYELCNKNPKNKLFKKKVKSKIKHLTMLLNFTLKTC